MTLSVVTGLTGAMLLLVGLVGGGFTFSGSVFPKVGGLMRVPCLAAGSLLLIVSVSLAGLEAGLLDPVPVAQNEPSTRPSTASTTSPSTASTASSASSASSQPSSSTSDDASTEVGAGTVVTTTDVYRGPTLDSQVIGSLNQGSEVVIYCTAQGEVVQLDSGEPSSLWDFVGNGFVPDVVVDTGTNQPVASRC